MEITDFDLGIMEAYKSETRDGGMEVVYYVKYKESKHSITSKYAAKLIRYKSNLSSEIEQGSWYTINYDTYLEGGKNEITLV